jgi:molybdopterin-guanine dinucleotide biosynthesis protein A
MGRNKALLPFRGAVLAEAVARAVESAAGTATLIGDPEVYARLGYPVIPDLYPGEGPLGGILGALAHTAADFNLVVACDMPELSAEFLRALLDAACLADQDALVPRGPSGRLEPLCAVYHRRSHEALHRAFTAGIRKVTAAFSELRIAAWPVSEIAPLQNVNTPEDWADHAAK